MPSIAFYEGASLCDGFKTGNGFHLWYNIGDIRITGA